MIKYFKRTRLIIIRRQSDNAEFSFSSIKKLKTYLRESEDVFYFVRVKGFHVDYYEIVASNQAHIELSRNGELFIWLSEYKKSLPYKVYRWAEKTKSQIIHFEFSITGEELRAFYGKNES